MPAGDMYRSIFKFDDKVSIISRPQSLPELAAPQGGGCAPGNKRGRGLRGFTSPRGASFCRGYPRAFWAPFLPSYVVLPGHYAPA